MKTFRIWLEERDNIQDVILTKLGLDKNTGLGAPLKGFDHDTNGDPFVIRQLEDLGEWKSLSPEKQAEARSMIARGEGTVGDLVNLLSSIDDTGEKLGIQPPEGGDEETPQQQPPPPSPQQPPQKYTPPLGYSSLEV
jgi:hypothetical protein